MIIFILFSVAINIIVNTLFISQFGIIATALSSLASSVQLLHILSDIFHVYHKSKVFK